jgi:hypothetical protein
MRDGDQDAPHQSPFELSLVASARCVTATACLVAAQCVYSYTGSVDGISNLSGKDLKHLSHLMGVVGV